MSTARWNQKEAGGKHSKEEYDNRIMEANATNVGANATNMEANATNMGAKKEKKCVCTFTPRNMGHFCY